MRLTWNELANYRGHVTLVDGSFDPLHPGHLEYFTKAKALGYPVVCNICPDSYTTTKHPIFQSAEARAEILASMRTIDHVHVSDVPTFSVLKQLQPAIYAKGDEWQGRLPMEIVDVCAVYGIRLVFTGPSLASSSAMLRQWQPDVDAFERLVQGQQPAETPWKPVTDYSFEARKAIEGKHPELIRLTFRPKLVVDAGSGPGHLVRLLREIGIEAHGFDVQPQGDWCQRRDITRADFTMSPSPFDLVICREVLEHLTIRQIRRAVANLCQLSSRFVYLTTRFTDAKHFLDFATSDGLDPTHISIQPQAWLRHLFTLEGFIRRADLEAKMDWKRLGRVLVYERAS